MDQMVLMDLMILMVPVPPISVSSPGFVFYLQIHGLCRLHLHLQLFNHLHHILLDLLTLPAQMVAHINNFINPGSLGRFWSWFWLPVELGSCRLHGALRLEEQVLR